MGRSELLDQDRYRTVEARNRNIDELYVLLEEMLEKRSRGLAKISTNSKSPRCRISSVDDLFDDEHLTAVDFFHEVLDSENENYLAPRAATRFSASPLESPRRAASLDRLGAGNRRRRAMAGRRVTAAAS
ncbi:hypothetical protein GS884_00115 [Rhodococcus hoagii]|nr:hypothetical protein [Prescottella equi]